MNSSSPSLAFPQSLAIDFRALGPVVALVALFILGAVINDAFYSAGNLTNILTRSAFIGIIAVGATFVITAGGIDLSVGSMAAFISGCMIVVMNGLIETLGTGWPTILAGIAISIVLGTAAGALNGLITTRGKVEAFIVLGTAAGALNGLITTRGKVEAFIVTLGTMGIYRSLVTYIADGGTLSLDFAVRGVYRPFYYGDILGIPVPVLVFAAVAVLGYLALNKTRFGRHHHLCTAAGLGVGVDRRPLGARSHRRGDHRRHGAEGRLRPHRRHRGRRHHADHDRQHPQPGGRHQQLPERDRPRHHHHRRRLPATR